MVTYHDADVSSIGSHGDTHDRTVPDHVVKGVRTVGRLDSGEPLEGRCELDSHADTCVAGSNTTPLSFESETVTVSGYSKEIGSLKGDPHSDGRHDL